ncbi:MerR family transcriptional regulator [Actinomadura sp. 9N215]|uniref:MerR family transcriptional regulator n=1 Tax=Actinomadura sp. 9N215 TaxID=3375150 RepID=UPI0037A642AE
MLIGELAHAAGTTIRALRYYEQQGLLHPRRAPNGYRHYEESSVTRVRNIRRLLALGFTADDIRSYLPCLDGEMPHGPASPANIPQITRKLGELEEKIAALNAVRERLIEILAHARNQTGNGERHGPGGARTQN